MCCVPPGNRVVVEMRDVDRREVVRHARLRQAEQLVEIDAARAVVARTHEIAAAMNLVERVRAERCEAPAHVPRDEAQERHRILGGAGKLAAQHGVLRRDADRARVEVALVRVDASERDQQRRAEAEHVGAEHRGDDHVAARLEAAVDAQCDAAAQTVRDQRVVRLDEAELPRQAGVLDGAERRSARAAVVARDVHDVRARLRDAACDVADAGLRDQLHRDLRLRVRAAQVVDQLRKIFDRVDVVVRRRRDERLSRDRAAQRRDLGRHLEAGNLPAFAGLRALRDLDLELFRGGEVLGRDAEARRCDLLDRVERARRILAALAAVAARAGELRAERDRFVRLRPQRAERHRRGDEARDDRLFRLHLVDRKRIADRHRLDEVAQRDRLARLQLIGQREERRLVTRDDRSAQVLQQRRIVVVLHAVATVAEQPALRRLRAVAGERRPRAHVFVELVESDRRHVRRHPGETRRHDLVAQAERLERLRAHVRAQRADAELCEHLHETRRAARRAARSPSLRRRSRRARRATA